MREAPCWPQYASDVPVRAMYRSQADAAKAPQGVATVIADFTSVESMKRRSRYRLGLPRLLSHPAAGRAGNQRNRRQSKERVKHIVLSSSLRAADYPLSFPAWHRKVEDALKASGLGYTILRPNSFMQNILAYLAPTIVAGSFYAAMGDAQTSYLDVPDIGAVVASVAESRGAQGKTYELNGPEAVTSADLAQRIARVCRGKSDSSIYQKKSSEMPCCTGDAPLASGRLARPAALLHQRAGWRSDDVLAQLLGRPPVNLDSFLEEYKDTFRAKVARA